MAQALSAPRAAAQEIYRGERRVMSSSESIGQYTCITALEGKLPLKLEVGAYYNALRPKDVGTWQLLTAAALVF
jgi:hypothetical protein